MKTGAQINTQQTLSLKFLFEKELICANTDCWIHTQLYQLLCPRADLKWLHIKQHRHHFAFHLSSVFKLTHWPIVIQLATLSECSNLINSSFIECLFLCLHFCVYMCVFVQVREVAKVHYCLPPLLPLPHQLQMMLKPRWHMILHFNGLSFVFFGRAECLKRLKYLKAVELFGLITEPDLKTMTQMLTP